jgi:acid phosphatase (class A)
MKHVLIAFAGVAALAAGLGAASAQPGPAAVVPMAMTAKTPASKFLEPDELRPEQTLPAPPADGSPAQREELAELHRIEAARTPARFEQAKIDDADATENIQAFQQVLGPQFQLAKLPATAALFNDLRAEDSVAAKRAKAYFQRTRPWAADPSLHGCDRGHDAVKSSYPSGHATMAFAHAAALAQLMPAKAQAVMAKAADYSESRLVCGVHYRRDIVAGQALGTVLLVKLLEKPAFRAEFDAARAELKAAHLTE